MKLFKKLHTLIIYGCGGHGRSVADIALSNGVQKLIFIDEHANKDEKIFGFDVIKSFPENNKNNYIIAIGDNIKRYETTVSLIKLNKNIINILSDKAYLSKQTDFGSGIFVGDTAHIGPNAKIGNGTIINTHSIIEHDCTIGDYCHISINAVVAGKTNIGNFVMIGASATVIDGLSICSHVTVGAGAVVTNNIIEPGIYVGTPAKKIQDKL